MSKKENKERWIRGYLENMQDKRDFNQYQVKLPIKPKEIQQLTRRKRNDVYTPK